MSEEKAETEAAPKKKGGARPGAGRKEKTLESEAARYLFGGGDMDVTSGMAELRKIIIGDAKPLDKIAACRLLAEILSGKFTKEAPKESEADPARKLSFEELQAKAREILGEASGRPGSNTEGTGKAQG